MLLAVVASVSLYFLDTRLDYFKPIRASLSTVVYPVQKLASMPDDLVTWFSEQFQGHRQLHEKIMTLESQNLTNSVRMQKMQALESENMRLRELLGSSFRLQERVQVAELLSVDLDPFYQHVIIDKGISFGVYEGQPVLDSLGVMGQVAEVSQFSSRVVLLTDPSHSIPVQIVRNGLRAVVTGRGLGEALQMEFLPHNADVRVDDVLVTSGLGGRFPVGYPVGTVTSVDFPQGKSFAEIAVTPAAHLSTSREVLLVLPGEKIDFEATFPVEIENTDVLPDTTVQPIVDEVDTETPSEGNN